MEQDNNNIVTENNNCELDRKNVELNGNNGCGNFHEIEISSMANGQRYNHELGRESGRNDDRENGDYEMKFLNKKQKKVTITFKNVSFDLKKNDKKLSIIKNITGMVSPGELVGVFGPSGSGKTTLLDILANRKNTGEITGSILINGSEFKNGYKRICSYVTQEDNLLVTLTVRETFQFNADLRLPASFTQKQKQDRIDWVLSKVGLTHRANTIIGGALPGGILLRGLSGGEKRRVNLGCGLLTMPSIIILDEPTSGLDSTCAMSVMKTLVDLSRNNNITVLCSIHQPRSEIYHLFTKVLVLATGRLVYYGSRPVEHFMELGIRYPEQTNPADYILDAVTQLSESGQVDEVADSLMTEYSQQIDTYLLNNHDPSTTNVFVTDDNVGMLRQFSVLCSRNFWDYVRNPYYLFIRVGTGLLVGILFGTCFYKLSLDRRGCDSRASLLFFMVVSSMLQPFCSVSLFISKRLLFNAERAMMLYHSLPYYLCSIMFEIMANVMSALAFGSATYWMSGLNPTPDRFFFSILLSCISLMTTEFVLLLVSTITINMDITFAIGATIIITNQLFTGFFVKTDSLPGAFGWIHHVNYAFYIFRAFLVNEFTYDELECDKNDPTSLYIASEDRCMSGQEYINNFDVLNGTSKFGDMGILILFAFIYFLLNYFALHYFHREKR